MHVSDPWRPPTSEHFATTELLLEAWLADQAAENPAVVTVEKDQADGEPRFLVRVTGEEKETFSIWFHLRQRTLHIESYMMPAPEERQSELYEYLLRRNLKLQGVRFAIGAEDAVFVVGETPLERVTELELDQLFGAVYAYVEQCFRPAMRIGFASRFTG